MDMHIEIECPLCGLKFREGFMEMPHGSALRCPFCLNVGLSITGREGSLLKRLPEAAVFKPPAYMRQEGLKKKI